MDFEYSGKRFRLIGASEEDHIVSVIRDSGSFYELDLLEYMRWVLKKREGGNPAKLVLDVGANIGNHAVFIGTFIAEHVLAIEPNPESVTQLRENLKNNLENYTIHDCALGESSGHGRVHMPENATNNLGMAKIVTEDGGPIRVRTLDELIIDRNENQEMVMPVSGMKIDVEGMELFVLKGACDTLQHDYPELFIEAATPSQLAEIKEFLGVFGYRKVATWAATPTHHFTTRKSNITRLSIFIYKLKRRVKYRLQRLTGRA
tara:strand:+ start:1013 stop:1795 length:783 start_codon:yes stop_codon:yes gene_type:complete